MRSFIAWIIAAFASPFGLVLLAALDSTVFFSLPFGIDGAVIIAAAARANPWAVPLLATIGSVAGAAVSYWMGAKAGEKGLGRYVPGKRLARIKQSTKKHGAVAIALLDLIPPPFPFTPFILAAGALEVHPPTLFVTLAASRLVRFGLEAYLAKQYGRHVLEWIESGTFRDFVGVCIVLAAVVSAISIVRVIKSSRPASPRTAA